MILNDGIGPQFTQNIFLVFGALSLAASALFMFVQRDLKRLLAYSSVENIGLIVLSLGIGGPAGVLAALLHAINHSLVKSMLFCTSGNILMKYHTRDLGRIRGMLHAAPLTSLFLIAGGLALVGSPPFNIFISKFSIISAGMYSGYLWLMVVCLLFLALIFAAFLRVISSSVFGELPEEVRPGEFRFSMIAPVAALLVLVVLLGLFMPPPVAALLNQATLAATHGSLVAGAPMLTFDGPSAAAPVGLLQLSQWFVR